MKKILFLLFATISFLAAKAQAVEAQVPYNKVNQPAVTAEFITDVDIAEKAVSEDLKTRGFGKGKSAKGFTLYQAINFTEISADKIDLYIKTEKKSKKEKDKTILTVLVSKGYDNFVSSTTEPKMIAAVMNYVNGLKPKFETGNLEVQIKEQEDVIKKEEKRQNNLIDDGTDLEKKKRKVEDDIASNKKDQEKQKAEVEKQKQILETLKKQLKN
jgi:hypothetical protein